MPRFRVNALGDAIQLAASVGVVAGLALLIVLGINEMRRPARTAEGPPRAMRDSETRSATLLSAGREAELRAFVHQRCPVCHGHGQERSLGPALSPVHLDYLSTNAVALTILHGRTTKGMPAWESELSPSDAYWIAGYLKDGGFAE